MIPLALLGAGVQMYGANQRDSAMDVANYGADINNRINSAGLIQDQSLTNQVLGKIGQQWYGSQETAVNDLSAANQRGAFNQGSQELGAGINAAAGQPMAIDPAVMAEAENTAFMRHRASQNASNQIRTDALNKVLMNNAGLESQGMKVRAGFGDLQDRNQMILSRINDTQRLQNYANAIREAALRRTSTQHGLDTAQAAQAGSGAMYLGALMQSGAVLANRPQFNQNPGMTGQFGSAVNGVDGPSNLGNTNPMA